MIHISPLSAREPNHLTSSLYGPSITLDIQDIVCNVANSGGQSTPFDNLLQNAYREGGSEYHGILSLLHIHTFQAITIEYITSFRSPQETDVLLLVYSFR